ncbi:hypothetical protein M0805_008906 [Coniferiporia weirii]|nr:hypothetical protein M0805_008906 [Coniferiporia weirii]
MSVYSCSVAVSVLLVLLTSRCDMGIAIWIMPPSAEATKLKRLMHAPAIDSLAYRVPPFEPHITLASFPSSTPIASLRSALTGTLAQVVTSPLHITFAALAAGDHFFRSVLVDVVQTPALDALLAGVGRAAEQSLGGAVDARSPRFPHLSLLYVPNEHAADRGRVRDALWDAFGVRTDSDETGGGRIAFNLPDETHRLAARFEGFDASEAWIVRCEGGIEDWEVLDKIPIGA